MVSCSAGSPDCCDVAAVVSTERIAADGAAPAPLDVVGRIAIAQPEHPHLSTNGVLGDLGQLDVGTEGSLVVVEGVPADDVGLSRDVLPREICWALPHVLGVDHVRIVVADSHEPAGLADGRLAVLHHPAQCIDSQPFDPGAGDGIGRGEIAGPHVAEQGGLLHGDDAGGADGEHGQSHHDLHDRISPPRCPAGPSLRGCDPVLHQILLITRATPLGGMITKRRMLLLVLLTWMRGTLFRGRNVPLGA